LRWPLHALGDATVPMHITTTTSWGHRPYEDAINARLSELGFDGRNKDQLEQARRILKQAFRVRSDIKTRRTTLGQPDDTHVRELVTQLALETLQEINQLGGDWFCDTCSLQYLLLG